MGATETVEVTLTDLFVPEENFLFYSSREELMSGDEANLAGNIAPMLGVATGSVRTLKNLGGRRSRCRAISGGSRFSHRADRCESGEVRGSGEIG